MSRIFFFNFRRKNRQINFLLIYEYKWMTSGMTLFLQPVFSKGNRYIQTWRPSLVLEIHLRHVIAFGKLFFWWALFLRCNSNFDHKDLLNSPSFVLLVYSTHYCLTDSLWTLSIYIYGLIFPCHLLKSNQQTCI